MSLNQKQETDKSMFFISEAVKTARVIGTQKTIQAVINARQPRLEELNKQVTDLIKKHLCESFGLTVHQLVNGTTKGNRTDALMVGYVLTKKHLEYTLYDIAVIFNKDKSNVSKLITVFNKLNPDNSKQHKALIEHYERINEIIVSFKNKNFAWPDEAN